MTLATRLYSFTNKMFGSSIHMNTNADYLGGVWKSYIAYFRTTVGIYKITNGIA
jgi:hypothetical protein